jgi:hypothetical protein
MQDYSDPNATMAMMGGMMGAFMIVGLIFLALWIFFWWKIFSQAGYNGALSLIWLACIIPLVGMVVPIILIGLFAFAKWPALNKS